MKPSPFPKEVDPLGMNEIELKLDESETERFKKQSVIDNVLHSMNRIDNQQQRRQ